jgi:hypothetical protein
MPVPVKDKVTVAPSAFVKVALWALFGVSELGYHIPV